MRFVLRFSRFVVVTLLRLALLPLLVAVATPIAALMRLARLLASFFRASDPLDATPSRCCVVVLNAASSFEAEALVRFWATRGASVVAVDRNAAVLDSLFRHDTKAVHCVAISSSGDAKRAADAVSRTGRALRAVIVVEPSGDALLRRAMEREAILENNLRDPIANPVTNLIAALGDFASLHAEGAATSSATEAAASTNEASALLSDALLEAAVSQPLKLTSAVLSALIPVMDGGSYAKQGTDAGGVFASLFGSGFRSTPPRVVFASRAPFPQEAVDVTCAAYLLAAQQQMIPQQQLLSIADAPHTLLRPLDGFAVARRSALRALLRAQQRQHDGAIAFREIRLLSTRSHENARIAFFHRAAEFGACASHFSPAENRAFWRCAVVVHGANQEILASASRAFSPGATSGAAAASTIVDATLTKAVVSLGAAVLSDHAVAYRPCLQPAETPLAVAAAVPAAASPPSAAAGSPSPAGSPGGSNSAAAVGGAFDTTAFVAASWMRRSAAELWEREARLVRHLFGVDQYI